MNYSEEVITQADLAQDVLCFWQMTGNVATADGLDSRFLPKGQNLLIFNFGSGVSFWKGQEAPKTMEEIMMVPAIATSKIVHQQGKIDLFGITLIGEGLYKLAQLPVASIVEVIPGELLAKLQQLHAKLQPASWLSKQEIASDFLRQNLNQNLSSPPFQEAIQLIKQANGNISVHDIADQVYTSERQLQRLFKTRFGLSPKAYCKVMRVNSYLEYILQQDAPVDWMDLVIEYNYHDQAHLINEVKSIASLPPTKLLGYRDTLYHRYTKQE